MCAVAGMPVRVTVNCGVAPIPLAASTARQHRPRCTARGSFKGGILYILGVDTDLGSEGGTKLRS